MSAPRGSSVPDSSVPEEHSLGELVAQMSEQTSRLIRDELRLATAEMTEKGKRAGIGAGLFGGAGLIAAYGVGCLVAAAILAVAGPLPGWASALIIGAVLLLVAGVTALLGKRQVSAATPAMPEQTVDSVKADVQAVKDHAGHRA